MKKFDNKTDFIQFLLGRGMIIKNKKISKKFNRMIILLEVDNHSNENFAKSFDFPLEIGEYCLAEVNHIVKNKNTYVKLTFI